jgi:CelD/BcsL family acetyltransferase involved in cellulose biosynthesis
VTLYEIDPLRDQRWLEFVEHHPGASLFHTSGWLQALQRTYGYGPVVFSDAPSSAPLRNGLLFCRVRSWITGSRLVSLPFSDHCEPLVESSDALRQMIDALRARMSGEGRYLEIRPLSDVAATQGLPPSAEYCIHSVDLRAELAAVFARFHRNHVQRNIRKAERANVEVEAGRSADLLHTFYALHTMTRRRQGVPVQPLSWFRNVVDSLGDRVTVQVARYQGRAVAAMVTALHRRTLVYKYGCSDVAYNRLGATPLLFWRAIEAATARGAEQLDLGRTDLDNEGLLAFKDHLGGIRRPLAYYRCGVKGGSRRGKPWAPTVARHAYALVPKTLQVSLGRALYRHFA